MRDDFKNYSIDDFRKFEGIEWVHGVSDCYSLIQRVYWEMFSIPLSDYDRKTYWWVHPELFDLYRQHYEQEGFIKVEITEDNPLQIGDAILMTIGCEIPCHAAIYIGDNKILHHFMNKESSIEEYNGIWKQTTSEVIRHRNFL